VQIDFYDIRNDFYDDYRFRKDANLYNSQTAGKLETAPMFSILPNDLLSRCYSPIKPACPILLTSRLGGETMPFSDVPCSGRS
jgi:hypothetical protein